MLVLEQLYAFCSIPSLLCCVVVVLLTVWYLHIKRRLPDDIPPFPVKPYPILGHIPMLGKDTLVTLKEWKRTTGEVYSIYIGQTLTIVLNSYRVAREALVKQADYFSDRPHRFVDTDERFAGGIVDTNGPLWKEQRAVTVNILKKLGLGKNWIDEKVIIEVQAYVDALTKTNGEPTDVRPLTCACVSNVICTILIGQRFELDDPYFQRLLEVLTQQIRYLQNTSVLKVFPWLKYLPGDLFNAKAMIRNEEMFRSEFSLKHIHKIRENEERSSVETFVSSYLEEERGRKGSGQDTTLDEHNLTMVITNLFQAGTETTSTTLTWAMAFLLHNPHVQRKLHQEIDEIIGPDRVPVIDDRRQMKYLQAFILETQRLGSVGPLSLPHLCSKTTTVGGYTIPEGSMVLPHLSAILQDAQTWGDPSVFRPERFLSPEDGSLVIPDCFIPFSIGRRACPGDSLAKTELFLFVTGLLQRFELLPSHPDSLPCLEPVFGLAATPKPFKLRFVPRKQ